VNITQFLTIQFPVDKNYAYTGFIFAVAAPEYYFKIIGLISIGF